MSTLPSVDIPIELSKGGIEIDKLLRLPPNTIIDSRVIKFIKTTLGIDIVLV